MEVQWFFCARCQEDGVLMAKKRALADTANARKLADVMRSAKAVCGWMLSVCRHKSHCQPATPPDVVLDLWRDGDPQARRHNAHERAPENIQEMCRRLEQASREAAHRQKAEEYERQKKERDLREAENASRRQRHEKDDLVERNRRFQKKAWERNFAKGLRPVEKRPGPPLTRYQFENLFCGKDRHPPYELLQDFGSDAVLAGMDAWHRHSQTYEQKERSFFAIIRRIQRGFGVDWMTVEQIKAEGLVELPWDDKRGPYLSQAGDEESDLPIEWYDGGDSKVWRKRQQEAQETYLHTKKKTNESIADLLGKIGQKINDK